MPWISSWKLPDSDGLESASNFLRRVAAVDTPFVLGNWSIGGGKAAAECIDCGASDYVLKDRFRPASLLR